LFGWATPKGWRQGLRPQLVAGAHSDGTASASVDSGRRENQQLVKSDIAELVCQIEAFETPLGKALYRGLLKTVARVWRPSHIQDVGLLRKQLTRMQGAERGLRQLEAAVGITGPDALARILESLKLDSMERNRQSRAAQRSSCSLRKSRPKARLNYKSYDWPWSPSSSPQHRGSEHQL
jgi:hypothetical protein